MSFAVRQVARESAVPVLLGSDQYEWRVVGTRREAEKSFNAAFMLRPDGTTAAVYRKMHLVPWGEYVPLKDWLTFVGPLVQAIGRGFDAGDTVTLLPLGSHRVSAAICYEIIYPELVRQFVARRKRAADDDHQRFVVRPIVRAVSAFRAGVDARDRRGPVSRPRAPTPA